MDCHREKDLREFSQKNAALDKINLFQEIFGLMMKSFEKSSSHILLRSHSLSFLQNSKIISDFWISGRQWQMNFVKKKTLKDSLPKDTSFTLSEFSPNDFSL